MEDVPPKPLPLFNALHRHGRRSFGNRPTVTELSPCFSRVFGVLLTSSSHIPSPTSGKSNHRVILAGTLNPGTFAEPNE